MAHSTIVFKHPTFGTTKSAPVGYSWTTFFFGFFPALFRGDFKWAAVNFAVTALAGAMSWGLAIWIVWIVFGLVYNKLYIQGLLSKGYLVQQVDSKYTLEQLQAQMETVLKRLEPPAP